MTSSRSSPAVDALAQMLPGIDGLAAENIQARLRMVTLMALSNRDGHMLLTTGNKSEMSVGYATLYGDMAGGYSVLKDAYKTTVFALSRWRNAHKPDDALGPDGPVMPQRIIDKPPTAELRHDQKDEDSLPPYDVLDRILHALVEQEQSVAEAARTTGADAALVADIERRCSAPNISAARPRPGSRSAPATSAATAATPSPTPSTRTEVTMSEHVETGERLVAAAKPRFKDFRVDFEKISTAASKAAREGRDGLDPATAIVWFNDVDWHLRIPLQRHYADHGAFEAVAHYHAKRFKDLFGAKDPWPDAPAEDALRLFAEHGRADVGVDLVRTIVDMQLKRLRKRLVQAQSARPAQGPCRRRQTGHRRDRQGDRRRYSRPQARADARSRGGRTLSRRARLRRRPRVARIGPPRNLDGTPRLTAA